MKKPVPPLGHFLILAGAEEPKVREALRVYYSHDDKRAGEFCVSIGACSREQLCQAMALQSAHRGDAKAAAKWLEEQAKVHEETTRRIEKSFAEIKAFTSRYSMVKI